MAKKAADRDANRNRPAGDEDGQQVGEGTEQKPVVSAWIYALQVGFMTIGVLVVIWSMEWAFSYALAPKSAVADTPTGSSATTTSSAALPAPVDPSTLKDTDYELFQSKLPSPFSVRVEYDVKIMAHVKAENTPRYERVASVFGKVELSDPIRKVFRVAEHDHLLEATHATLRRRIKRDLNRMFAERERQLDAQAQVERQIDQGAAPGEVDFAKLPVRDESIVDDIVFERFRTIERF